MIFRTPITTLTKGDVIGYDAHGNPTYGPDVEGTIHGELRPLQGDEPATAFHDRVVTRYRLYAPPTATLTAYDSIRILGSRYGLIGQPEPHTIGGRLHHYEVIVERTTG